MSVLFSSPSKVFCDFRSIDKTDFHYIVKFYEDTLESDLFLKSGEELIMQFYYALSLFETNELTLFIKQADDILAYIFQENISSIDGHDVLYTLLSKKSLATFQLGNQREAFELSNQLYRIYNNAESLSLNKALLTSQSKHSSIKMSIWSAMLSLLVMTTTFSLNSLVDDPANYIIISSLMGLILFTAMAGKRILTYNKEIKAPLKAISQNL